MPSTLLDLCEFREEIRKSRFITLASPINSAAEAMSFIERHSDLAATHNCWAWKIGGQYRSNDDGEPGGTAGRPILAAIEAQDCDQVVVLVIRWYGGIQLAPAAGARLWRWRQQCLQQAPKRLLVQRSEYTCSCTFSELALVKLRLAEVDGLVLDEQFTANGVDLHIAVGEACLAVLQQQLADLSRGRILLETR